MEKILATLALGLSLSIISTAQATEFTNYNRGYCVPNGAPLQKENAIVTIEENRVNGTMLLVGPKNHMFFSPNTTVTLNGLDWEGNFKLEKTGEANGFVINAILESRTHDVKFDKQLVQCIADDI